MKFEDLKIIIKCNLPVNLPINNIIKSFYYWGIENYKGKNFYIYDCGIYIRYRLNYKEIIVYKEIDK